MYFTRRQRLIETFPEHKIEAFLITGMPNVRYLSGFTGSNAALLVTPNNTVLYTDPRYTVQAEKECDCAVRTVKAPLAHAVAATIRQRRFRKVGFERQRILWATHFVLTSKLPKSAGLVPVDNAVETLRMVKSAEEITAIRRSVELNSQAFERALKRFKPDMRESQLAAEIEFQMRQLGASKPAFDTIVASGARTALPHAQPEALPILVDQLLLIDMGSTVEGYTSDMTRTLAVGRTNATIKKMYGAVLEAQQAALVFVRPGVSAAAVDRVARDVFKKHGLDREFVHSTGHGLGLEIHETPRLGRKEKTKLQAGMTITIEPGVYREGVGGIRIEDTVLVTATGCEILTPTSKEFLSI